MFIVKAKQCMEMSKISFKLWPEQTCVKIVLTV